MEGGLKLPLTYLVVNYSIWAKMPLSLNFAYDIWITKERFPRKASKRDVEVMIWLYHTGLTPAGKMFEETIIPVIFNEERLKVKWEVWIGEGGWDIVTFKPSRPLIGKVKLSSDLMTSY